LELSTDTMPKDCYFFVDPDPKVPEKEKTMTLLCVPCRDKHMPDSGWFYPGSKEGFGPYDYQCRECGEFVYKADEEENDETPSGS
jgi:hypothetical protein